MSVSDQSDDGDVPTYIIPPPQWANPQRQDTAHTHRHTDSDKTRSEILLKNFFFLIQTSLEILGTR